MTEYPIQKRWPYKPRRSRQNRKIMAMAKALKDKKKFNETRFYAK